MRRKKCDYCGRVVTVDNDEFYNFADLTIDSGWDFDTFELCGDCADTIVKICKKTRGEEKNADVSGSSC